MKLNLTRNASRLTLFAAALLATTLFAGRANAQSSFQGKFTLQHETRWGQAVLPAGNYLLSFDHNSEIPGLLVIRDAKSLRFVAYEPANNAQDSSGGGSALLVSVRGSQQNVQALRIAELGQVFVYDRALADRREVEEARQTQAVPVIVAKK